MNQLNPGTPEYQREVEAFRNALNGVIGMYSGKILLDDLISAIERVKFTQQFMIMFNDAMKQRQPSLEKHFEQNLSLFMKSLEDNPSFLNKVKTMMENFSDKLEGEED